MQKFERKEIKENPEFAELMKYIGMNHVNLPATVEKLSSLKIPDLCAVDKHYFKLVITGVELYFSYETQSWYIEKTNSIGVKIDSITMYENYIEYEGSRTKDLMDHPTDSMNGNISLN